MFNGPSSNGAFTWSANNVQVKDGGLVISMQHTQTGWTAGGISQGGPGTRFGLYQIRARAEAGHGVGPVILLWPASNRWPGPELDLMESPDGDRSGVWISQHWRDANGQNALTATTLRIDATQWHIYGVDWRPESLNFSIDGAIVVHATENVSDEPAWIALQGFVAGPNDAWYGGAADGTTPASVRMYVDWVEVTGACLPGEHPGK
jgi:beta-glucanase (GH16 family)